MYKFFKLSGPGTIASIVLVIALNISCSGKGKNFSTDGRDNDIVLNELITKGGDQVEITIPERITIKLNTIKLILINGKKVTIRGEKNTTIEGDGTSHLFEITSTGKLTLSGLLLTKGKSAKSNAAATGGAIRNFGQLFANDCVFKNNSAQGGGAIANYNTIVIEKSVFAENNAELLGGAIFCSCERNPAMVENCIFENNKSALAGGAIYTQNSMMMINLCTFEGNKTGNTGDPEYGGGGAICNTEGAVIMDGGLNRNDGSDPEVSRFVNNHAGKGGAIANKEGQIYILNGYTFKKNSADNWGGAIFNEESGTINLKDGAVIKGNTAYKGADIFNHSSAKTVILDHVTVGETYGEKIVEGEVDLSLLMESK